MKVGDKIIITQTTPVAKDLLGYVAEIVEASPEEARDRLPYLAKALGQSNVYWVNGILLTPLLEELL